MNRDVYPDRIRQFVSPSPQNCLQQTQSSHLLDFLLFHKESNKTSHYHLHHNMLHAHNTAINTINWLFTPDFKPLQWLLLICYYVF